jgi:hypothetical protein
MPDKDHWLSKVQPLGRRRVEVAYQRTFSASEADKLRAGLWPQEMDDRWVVHLGESSLDLWRSWTGHCIYSLPARGAIEGVAVGPLFVNSDSQQYQRPADAEDIRIFESIVARVLSV